MRLFIALKIPEELRLRLYRLCGEFAPLAQETAWCRPEQFHVTMAFIGEAAPAFVPHLCKALDQACAALPAVECVAEGFGYFGSSRQPAVLWVGVQPAYELEAAHEALWKCLRQLGYERLKYKFSPHITLARCKGKARNSAVLEAMDACPDHHFGAWLADGATLYESLATPQGSRYRPIHTAFFGAGK